MTDSAHPAPIPRSFGEYVRAMGPGIVVVLTWLGAGDLVDASVAGGRYGYSLMWVLALALLVRWLFVSAIARYQLCNQHGESVLEGLQRLHPWFPPFLLAAFLIYSHAVGIYMYLGLGESCRALAGTGSEQAWAVLWALVFYALVARPVFRYIERTFLLFLGILGISLLGAALWTGPDPVGILSGTVGFRLPEQRGDFDARLVAISLVGAVAGSLANLMYPYFIREKGWTTPQHLRVQRYDLGLGIAVIIVLDLAVWTLGAEILHARPEVRIDRVADLATLLTHTLGDWGGRLFYLGVFAAVGSSIVGNALAYGLMGRDAFRLWRGGDSGTGHASHMGYWMMTVWCLFSPLPWLFTGRGSFVAITVAVNAFQIVLLPILALAFWILTASKRFIGAEYRNTRLQNAGMALFLAIALLGAAGSLQPIAEALRGLWG